MYLNRSCICENMTMIPLLKDQLTIHKTYYHNQTHYANDYSKLGIKNKNDHEGKYLRKANSKESDEATA